MTWKVVEKFGTAEDVVLTRAKKSECTAYVKRRQEEHIRMASRYGTPPVMRKVRRFIRGKFRIERVQEVCSTSTQ